MPCIFPASTRSVVAPHRSHRPALRSASACRTSVVRSCPQVQHRTVIRLGGVTWANGSGLSTRAFGLISPTLRSGSAAVFVYARQKAHGLLHAATQPWASAEPGTRIVRI